MTLTSKFEGKCKDCGTPHKVGDLIDKNKNENWCKNWQNCQGKQQQFPSTSQPSQAPVSDTDAIQFAEKCVTSYITICLGNGLTKETIAAGASAVYNTAIMQKMRK